MPYLTAAPVAGKKRSRESDDATEHERAKPKSKSKTSKLAKSNSPEVIQRLEDQIAESREHYNNIATLLSHAQNEQTSLSSTLAAHIALCRVFCRLLSSRSLIKSDATPQKERVIVDWLRRQYESYRELLLSLLSSDDYGKQGTAVTLNMQLVKQETVHTRGTSESWKSDDYTFDSLMRSILEHAGADFIDSEFASKYLQYDDVRYYVYGAISNLLADNASSRSEQVVTNSIALLADSRGTNLTEPDTANFYGEAPERSNKGLMTLTGHKKQKQEAWLAVFRCRLSHQQRKQLLRIMTGQIAPWFTRLELLVDFMTDSYNEGGSTSLLALSGLYYLIQEKNLDYPSFYQKLYTLLDDDLLHSKHRSQFFRLLDEFLSSTHLPAVMVASFMKRLSRLALHAPPAGVVVVVPWIYNMIKTHPTTSFMIHREIRDADEKKEIEQQGMLDPFDMAEEDPMETNAIDSSLWEIETLQSVYHPNVATLAKIISEQFTKRSYNLEDFLDHTYAGMIEAELSKKLRRAPEIEYEIPKRILTDLDTVSGLNSLGDLLSQIVDS